MSENGQFRKCVSLLLILAEGASTFLPCASLAADPAPLVETRPPIAQAAPEMHSLTREVADYLKPPLVTALENAKSVPEPDLHFAADDPVLDQDPFFLGAQRIVARAMPDGMASEVDLSVTQLSGGLRIHASGPGIDAAWELKAPLHAVLETDAYVFFVPNDASYFREKRAGEGLFFLPKLELLQALAAKAPTPLYFFPLPNGDWHAPEQMTEMASGEALFVRDGKGIPFEILYRDLDQVRKAEHWNYVMANAFAAAALARQIREKALPKEQWERLRVAVEKYADTVLRNPEISPADVFASLREMQKLFAILPLPKSTAGFGTLLLDQKAQANVQASHPRSNSLFKSAYAADGKPPLTAAQKKVLEEQHDQLIERTTHVGIVLATGLIISIGLRYGVYREHFAELQRQKGITNVAELPPARRALLYAQETIGVYAHTLTALAQAPTLTAGHLILYGLDRYAPSATASENLWLRKMLNKTVLTSVRNASQTPVNAKTWYMGVLVLGGIDTLSVGVQLYNVVPWTAHHLASAMPFLSTRVADAFQVGDPLIEEFNRNEVVRNGFMYSTIGAMKLSSDMNWKVRQMVEGIVDAELRREGYNLADASTAAIKKERMDARVEEQMKRVGLPSMKEMLFDYNTIVNAAYRTLGFRALEKDGELYYVGQDRPGLVFSSLDAAVSRLKREVAAGSPKAIQALPLLERARSETGLLGNLLRELTNGELPTRAKLSETLAALREARKSLIALTYEGAQDAAVRNIPTEWVERVGLEGAEYAARTYRESFFGFLGEKKPEVQMPDGHFAKAQKSRAAARASLAYESRYRIPFDASASAEAAAEWRGHYQSAFLEILGLSPDYAANPQLMDEVLKSARSGAEKKVSSPEFQVRIRKLPFIEQQRLIADEYVEAEISEYLTKTVWSSSISRLDPAQPGLTQKIRQRPWFRRDTRTSKTAVRILRALDGFVAEAEYRPGLSSAIYRYVPGAFDLWQGFTQSLRSAPMSLTVNFAWQHVFWGADISWMNWTYFVIFTSFTTSGPANLVSRIFENQNWRPIKSVALMSALATAHTWTTFWGSVPAYIFARDFNLHFTKIMSATAAAVASVIGTNYLREERQRAIQEKARSAIDDSIEDGTETPAKKESWLKRCRLFLGPGK